MTEMCNEVQNAIALEGRAPDNEDLRQHVADCSDCASFLKSLLAVEDELLALASNDVDDSVVEKLLARPELSGTVGSHRTRHWIVGAMSLAAAAMIGFVAVSVTFRANQADRPAASIPETPRDRTRQESSGYLTDEALENQPKKQDSQPTGKRFSVDSEARMAEEEFEANRTDDDYLQSRNESVAGESKGKDNDSSGRVALSAPSSSPAAADSLLARETVSLGEELLGIDVKDGLAKSGELVELDKLEAGAFKSRVILGSDAEDYRSYQREAEPRKLVHVDAVYPEVAKQARASGTVVLRALIDDDGNVMRAIVVESIEIFDQAAVDAVLQWKYEASDREERDVIVRIAFEAAPEPDADARLFLEERERIDELRFRDARGYWANTYSPGDPKTRFLAMRLSNAHQLVAPHRAARPIIQPFDAPRRGALSLTLHADHSGITEPRRLLVQVGLQATESRGRRRPPMNVGIVLDARPSELAAARSLIDSLQQAKALGDRFRLILPGKGEIVSPASFRHGPLSVALDELDSSGDPGDLTKALRLAIERVHAGDDPTMPLGSSLVLVVTPRKLADELDHLSRLAHRSAIGGVPVSVVGIGAAVERSELERLALAGQGRRYFLEQPSDANSIIDRELTASSRVVARALRLRIKLAEGVKLVGVVGSEPLNELQSKRVREAEKSIDLRLSRNLGIEADRGADEDGIQIVIPSFYAGDSHTILLDVVATRPGPIAEVTARYKDLTDLRNTVARASLALPRATVPPGPLETNVLKNYLAFHLSEVLEGAADRLEQGDRSGAIGALDDVGRLLAGLPFESDGEIARDVAMLREYVRILSSSREPALIAYLADSLRYASASKRRLPVALI